VTRLAANIYRKYESESQWVIMVLYMVGLCCGGVRQFARNEREMMQVDPTQRDFEKVTSLQVVELKYFVT